MSDYSENEQDISGDNNDLFEDNSYEIEQSDLESGYAEGESEDNDSGGFSNDICDSTGTGVLDESDLTGSTKDSEDSADSSEENQVFDLTGGTRISTDRDE
jgi:hypothetical protein